MVWRISLKNDVQGANTFAVDTLTLLDLQYANRDHEQYIKTELVCNLQWLIFWSVNGLTICKAQLSPSIVQKAARLRDSDHRHTLWKWIRALCARALKQGEFHLKTNNLLSDSMQVSRRSCLNAPSSSFEEGPSVTLHRHCSHFNHIHTYTDNTWKKKAFCPIRTCT